MAWQLITVTQTLATKWGDHLHCQRCGRKLEVGEEVWRHYITRKRSSRTDYYCMVCYKKLWLKVTVGGVRYENEERQLPSLRKTDEEAPEKGRVRVPEPEVPRGLREDTSRHETRRAGAETQRAHDHKFNER